jgi:protein-S-isoprenylcysteine O-methyltransferase Ste14
MRLELKVPPVLQLLIAAGAMFAVDRAAGFMECALPLSSGLAIVLAILGSSIALLGVVAFRRAKTTVDPRYPDQARALVVSGVYQWTRNPMYLGMLLVLGAWAAYLSNLLGVIFLLLFWAWMTRFQIIPEERAMRANFATSYRDYCSRVPRWL